MVRDIALKGYYEGTHSKRVIDECDVQVMFQRTRNFVKNGNITIITAKARPINEERIAAPRIIDYIGMI